MAITASSTVDDARTEFLTNIDWEETGDTAKAKLFVTACKALLVLMPKETRKSRQGWAYDVSEIRRMMQAASGFVAVSAGGKVQTGFQGTTFRGSGFRG